MLHIGFDCSAPIPGRDLGNQRVLRCQNHECGAPQCVWPRREDFYGFAVLSVEAHLGAGDAEIPLLPFFLDDRRIAPFAMLVLAPHLFAGQRGVAPRTPIHGSLLTVGEIGLQHVQEEPLRPLVVPRFACDRLAVPSPHGAHLPQLTAQVFDVGISPNARIDAPSDGCIFCRQPKGIEPYREKDVGSLHALVTGSRVAGSHGIPMAHMQVPRGVGQHRQRVPLGPVWILHGSIQAQPFPFLLPLGLNGLWVVAGNIGRHAIRLGKPLWLGVYSPPSIKNIGTYTAKPRCPTPGRRS